MNRIVRMAAAAAVGALVLAGCGSSSKTLSKSELVSKGNAICTKDNAEIAKVKQPASLGDPAAVATYFKAILPIGKKGIDDLAALKPPKDLKSDYDAFIASDRASEKTVEDLIAAADAKDNTKAPALFAKLQTESKDSDTKATALGLTECAK